MSYTRSTWQSAVALLNFRDDSWDERLTVGWSRVDRESIFLECEVHRVATAYRLIGFIVDMQNGSTYGAVENLLGNHH